MKASIVTDAILINRVESTGRTKCLVVKLKETEHWEMFCEYQKLPSVVEFEGIVYGRSGWNSDTGEAYYKPDVVVARIL